MPVTIRPNTHAANSHDPWWRPLDSRTLLEVATLPPDEVLLRDQDCRHHPKRFLASSFDKRDLSSLIPSGNGFVCAAMEAYDKHHNLIIRPDDVWLAILTQLNFFVNKHAEELRDFFVSHQGKKPLIAFHDSGHNPADDATAFARLISKNIKDPKLAKWVMPDFSTTTTDDRTAASITMMGTFQAYFKYISEETCGIPSVTLEGKRKDWVKLVEKIEMLPRLGKEPTQFRNLLKPVLTRFVSSFDEPTSRTTREFWNQISHYHGNVMCGASPYRTGWITAFCFWTNKGDRTETSNELVLDGIRYPVVEVGSIPSGYSEVPYIYEGQKARMVAGSVAFDVTGGGQGSPECLDTLRPIVGWWMFTVGDKPGSDLADTHSAEEYAESESQLSVPLKPSEGSRGSSRPMSKSRKWRMSLNAMVSKLAGHGQA